MDYSYAVGESILVPTSKAGEWVDAVVHSITFNNGQMGVKAIRNQSNWVTSDKVAIYPHSSAINVCVTAPLNQTSTVISLLLNDLNDVVEVPMYCARGGLSPIRMTASKISKVAILEDVFFDTSKSIGGGIRSVISGTVNPFDRTYESGISAVSTVISRFDKDNDGCLSLSEFKDFLTALGKPESDATSSEVHKLAKLAGVTCLDDKLPLCGIHAFWHGDQKHAAKNRKSFMDDMTKLLVKAQGTPPGLMQKWKDGSIGQQESNKVEQFLNASIAVLSLAMTPAVQAKIPEVVEALEKAAREGVKLSGEIMDTLKTALAFASKYYPSMVLIAQSAFESAVAYAPVLLEGMKMAWEGALTATFAFMQDAESAGLKLLVWAGKIHSMAKDAMELGAPVAAIAIAQIKEFASNLSGDVAVVTSLLKEQLGVISGYVSFARLEDLQKLSEQFMHTLGDNFKDMMNGCSLIMKSALGTDVGDGGQLNGPALEVLKSFGNACKVAQAKGADVAKQAQECFEFVKEWLIKGAAVAGEELRKFKEIVLPILGACGMKIFSALKNNVQIAISSGLTFLSQLMEMFEEAKDAVIKFVQSIDTKAIISNAKEALGDLGEGMKDFAALASQAIVEASKGAAVMLLAALDNAKRLGHVVGPHIIEGLKVVAATGKEMAANLINDIKTALPLILDFLKGPALQSLQRAVYVASEAGSEAFMAIWEGLKTAVAAAVQAGKDAIPIITQIAPQASALISSAALACIEASKNASEMIAHALELAMQAGAPIAAALIDALRYAGAEMIQMGEEVKTMVKNCIGSILSQLPDGLIENLQNAIAAAASAGVEAFLEIWEKLKEGIEAAIAGGRVLAVVALNNMGTISAIAGTAGAVIVAEGKELVEDSKIVFEAGKTFFENSELKGALNEAWDNVEDGYAMTRQGMSMLLSSIGVGSCAAAFDLLKFEIFRGNIKKSPPRTLHFPH
jgi:hypothetical protein